MLSKLGLHNVSPNYYYTIIIIIFSFSLGIVKYIQAHCSFIK